MDQKWELWAPLLYKVGDIHILPTSREKAWHCLSEQQLYRNVSKILLQQFSKNRKPRDCAKIGCELMWKDRIVWNCVVPKSYQKYVSTCKFSGASCRNQQNLLRHTRNMTKRRKPTQIKVKNLQGGSKGKKRHGKGQDTLIFASKHGTVHNSCILHTIPWDHNLTFYNFVYSFLVIFIIISREPIFNFYS